MRAGEAAQEGNGHPHDAVSPHPAPALRAAGAVVDARGDGARAVALPRLLTVEAVVWAVILGAALGLRLAGLAEPPLTREESALAASALDVIQGRPVDLGHGPLPVYGTAAILFTLGANDLTARLLPLVAGLLVVAWPLAAKGLLGARASLAAALLLALSPTLVLASRSVGGEMVALAFGLYALLAWIRAARSGGKGSAVTAGVLTSLFLASGPAAYALLVPFLVALGLAGALKRQTPRTWTGKANWRHLLAGGGVTLALVATGLFSSPLGLQSGVVNVAAVWAGSLFPWQGAWGAGTYPLALLSYEMPLLALAVLSLASSRGRPVLGFLSLLATVGFAFALVTQPYTAGTQVVVVVALALAGGLGVAGVWDEVELRGTAAEAGLFAVATLPLVALGALVASYLSLPGARITPAFLLGPLVLLVLVSTGWVYLRGVKGVLSGLSLLLVLAAALFSFHSASGVATAGDRPLPLLWAETPSSHLRALMNELDANAAVYGAAGRRDLTVAVDDGIRYPFRWYLRDYSRVVYGPYQGSPTAVIARDADPGPTGDYRYKAYTLSTTAPVPGADLGALWRWFYYREPGGAPEREAIRLYFATRPSG